MTQLRNLNPSLNVLASDLYSGGALFESQKGHRLSWLRLFVAFPLDQLFSTGAPWRLGAPWMTVWGAADYFIFSGKENSYCNNYFLECKATWRLHELYTGWVKIMSTLMHYFPYLDHTFPGRWIGRGGPSVLHTPLIWHPVISGYGVWWRSVCIAGKFVISLNWRTEYKLCVIYSPRSVRPGFKCYCCSLVFVYWTWWQADWDSPVNILHIWCFFCE
jgi:hypothetical protein